MSSPTASASPRELPEPSELEMVRGSSLVLELLSGRCSVEVVYLLAGGTRRYSEVFYHVGEVSKKALTHTLRGLQGNGLVDRRAYAEVPPRVEYSLTPLGWSITSVLVAMHGWSEAYAHDVERARNQRATDIETPARRALAAVPRRSG